jgi:ATP-binding cassette subfamily G (WHITE) protein 2 (PDR)
MSLVGNFAFGNYDRTAEVAGSPSMARRDSRAAELPSDDSSELVELSKEKSSGDASNPHGDRLDGAGGERVHQLARRLTEQSMGDVNPFEAPEGSPLDPKSENFSARAWAKALLNLHSRDPEKYPKRTSGVAFQNLSVHGFGSETDYQKTVGNVFVEAVGIVRRILGVGQRRIQILRDFDGVLNSGDMLMVLGPPGSGCSTFLKTLSGETHGLYVDENSYLNYQGGLNSILIKLACMDL